MTKILASYPAFTVVALEDDHDIVLDNDKKYARTSSKEFYIKSFPKDKREYLRSFTIGAGSDGDVWAYGNGAMITAEQTQRRTVIGIALGDVLTIEGAEYVVEPDHNHNIKLTAV